MVTLGGHIKETGSTTKTKTGGWRTFKPVIHMDKCVDCGCCWIFCPDMSILRKDGEYSVDLEYCKGCGICSRECPTGAIEMVLEEK